MGTPKLYECLESARLAKAEKLRCAPAHKVVRDLLGVVRTALRAACSSVEARVFPFDDAEYDFSRRPEGVSARFSGVGWFNVVAVDAVNGLAERTSG